jgi:type I restriction enzyme S subunit
MGSVENIITENLPIWSSAVQSKSSAGRGTRSKRKLYGVKKLRELILDLAVRGLLVQQDPNDEPASILLEKISAKKEQLIKEGDIKNLKQLPPLAAAEFPNALPSSWQWARLGEITNYGMSNKAEPKDAGENTWVLELEDVEKETSRLIAKVRFSQRIFKSSKNIFKRGDVIYGKLRPYLDKVLVADEDGVCTTEMIPLRGHLEVYPQYLRLAMKSPRFKEYANNSTHGMNLPRMGTDKARLALIPVCPFSEQHRIVAKVDELMALCDSLEQQQEDSIQAHETLVEALLEALTNAADANAFQAAWQRISEHFDVLLTTDHSISKLKEATLQLAVMGKLVPQDPNDEPASVLLEKITVEKERLVNEGALKKQKNPSNIYDKLEIPVLPAGWSETAFGMVMFNLDAQRVPLSVEVRKHRKGSYDYYGASGVIDKIDDYLFDQPLLLIGEDGANLVNRSTPIAFIARGKYWVNNHAHVIGALNEISLNYMSIHINAISLIPFITGMAQPKMNQAKMNSIPILLPPLAEQHRIVVKVDEIMVLCDQLKVSLEQAQQTQIHLTDAVVENAL